MPPPCITRTHRLRPSRPAWLTMAFLSWVPLLAAHADDVLPEQTVTGTAMRRIDAETALPVTVIRRAEIERSGARDVAELLQRLPAMQGFVPGTAVTGTESYGYTSVSLHDLGDVYTLVLINGQRVAPSGGQQPNGALASVDLQALPMAMVERIEVLTDGASALYGADALGGVVNIITRRDGDANEATAGWQQARGGARTWSASAYKSVGDLQADGQTLAIGVSAWRRSALPATARSYARDAQIDFTLDGQRVRVDGGDFFSAPGQVSGQTAGLINPAYATTGRCPTGQYLNADYGTNLCFYNYAADLMLIPAQQQHSAMASYTRQVVDDNRWMLDALWSRSTVWSQLAPISTTLTVPASSDAYQQHLAGLGVTDDPVYAYTRLVDLGPRRERDVNSLLNLSGRAEGRLNGWTWQGGLMQSHSHQSSDIAGFMTQAGAQNLVGAGFDPFVSGGQQSAQGLAALQSQSYAGPWMRGDTLLQGLQWQASTALTQMPAGPLRWAIGGDWRQERWLYRPSAFAQGLLSDAHAGTVGPYSDDQLSLTTSFPLVPVSASRQVWGVFSEWLAPLLTTPDGERLEAGASVRHDQDNRVGGALTGKLHARWQLNPMWMWRASIGTGFRTPTLGQMASPLQSAGQTQQSHDCTATLQAIATQLGATPCDPASTGHAALTFAAVTQGNTQLQPERSQQASIGMRVEPLVGHSIGLDLWAVRIQDQIGVVSEQAAFANPQAVPWAWAAIPDGNGGQQLAYLGQPRNIQSFISSGIDLDASVRRGSAIGLIDSQLRVTTLLREDLHEFPGSPWSSNIGDGALGQATLRWRAQWRTSVLRGPWTHSLTARYQSGYDDAPVTLQVLDNQGQPTGQTLTWRGHVPGTLRWDWQTQWQLDAACKISAGVNNLFNRRPPTSFNTGGPYKAQIVGYDERYGDPLGRVFVLDARWSF